VKLVDVQAIVERPILDVLCQARIPQSYPAWVLFDIFLIPLHITIPIEQLIDATVKFECVLF
jgi:hypothetical protein